MEEIKKENLKEINGGGLTLWSAIGISAGVIFLIGVIDGFVRPLSCHE